MKRLAALPGLLLLAACTLHPGTALPLIPPITPTAGAAITPSAAAVQPCYFTWASQELPEVSAELQAAIQAVLPEATARAAAFGENCVAQDGSTTFGAMQADFYVTVPVPDLQDNETLGAALLAALEEAP